MAVEHLAHASYVTLPWKNGRGQTDEIYLAPVGGSRDDFELRISSAPIFEDGTFSSFPGADRVITLIEGDELELDFGASRHRLRPFAPFRFDTGLAPIGRPLQGPVRVFNVMASRLHWRHVAQEMHVGPGQLVVPADALVIVHIIGGTWRLRSETGLWSLAARDTAVLRGEPTAALASADADGRVLLLSLRPPSEGPVAGRERHTSSA